MNGEWQFAGAMVYMFANFHRLSADSYKYAELETLVGTAALMAEYNGLENAPHVQDKLAWLAMYTEGTEALGRVACENCIKVPDSDLVYPNPMYSNIAKFFFADNFPQAMKHVQDITGGIAATAFSSADYDNPQIRPLSARSSIRGFKGRVSKSVTASVLSFHALRPRRCVFWVRF